MKKSTILKIIVFIFALILVFCVIILYSKDINNLNFIKNMRQAIDEENNITTIDVTGIELGKETAHEHVYKTMYDEEKHWEECTICNETRNEVAHSFTTTWAAGSSSCNYNNSYIKTCKCGYSETGHKPCVWDGKSYLVWGKYSHVKLCKICKTAICYSYYLNSYGSGKLHNVSDNRVNPLETHDVAERCYSSDGSILTCENPGTCVACKSTFASNNHILNVENNGDIRCTICRKEFGTVINEISVDSNAPTTYTIISDIKLINGATFNKTDYVRNIGDVLQSSSETIISGTTGSTNVSLKTIAKFKSIWKNEYPLYAVVTVKINGIFCDLRFVEFTSYPDSIAPDISNISLGNSDEINIWQKSKAIVVSGTENYCNTVKVKILDDENNKVFLGETTVNNKNYSISCTPDVEAGVEGRKFKVIVTDSCENSTEQEFTISKIDSIPPEATSSTEVGGDWAKEKSFTATASDHGIGNVQIAFNDVEDYEPTTKNGTEYTRDYKLTGDVYSPIKARVFYKDELNNISSQEITIDKLDNTAPTITGSSFNNNKLVIEANDAKEGLGEGSGVVKYRFITSISKLDNPSISEENSTEVAANENIIIPYIATVKYVYAVAEDAVRKYE